MAKITKVKDITGFVGFTCGTKIWSRLINVFGGMSISHAVIGFLDKFVLEACSPKVKISLLKKYRRSVFTEFYVPVGFSQKQLRAGVEGSMMKYLDMPYGTKQLIGYLWVVFMKIFTGKIVRNPLEAKATRRRPNAVVCAELVLYYLRDELKMKEFTKINVNDPNFMAQVYDIVRTSKRFRKVDVTANLRINK